MPIATLAPDHAIHARLKSVAASSPSSTPETTIDEQEYYRTHFTEISVELHSTQHGTGTLYLTTKHVYWFSDDDQKDGFKIPYVDIVMHAIPTAGEEDTAERPYLYCQLQTREAAAQEEEEEEGEGEEEEMLLIPIGAIGDHQRAVETVQRLYEELSIGAEMNPDADIADNDDMMAAENGGNGVGEGWIFDDSKVRKDNLMHDRDEEEEGEGEGEPKRSKQ